jgi:Ca2+-binding EF-hand superfamily protein
MKPLIAMLTLALSLPVAAAAYAQDTPQRDPLRGFKLSDTNGDGQLSYDEYRAMSLKMIDRAVARRPEGRLASASPEQREALIKQRFAAIDTNKDGMIDQTEWTNRPHGRRANPESDHS